MNVERDLSREARVIHILYLLHGLAPFTLWLLAAIAVVIGMAKRPDVNGTYLESHISWLSRTFWWGLLWIAIGAVVTVILVITIVGILIWWLPWTILFLWYLYRVIRGWLRLNDRLPI
jgi:uncharacterized membrane protein